MTAKEYKDYINNAIHNDKELRDAYNELDRLYKDFRFPYEPEIAVQLKQKIRAYNKK